MKALSAADDGRMATQQHTSHPSDMIDADGFYVVGLVGPFSSEAEAQAYQQARCHHHGVTVAATAVASGIGLLVQLLDVQPFS